MSDIIPTVKVQPWGEGQGEFVEINQSDFDAKVHTHWVDPADTDEDGALTKAEIIADLEGMGEEFDPRAKKADLLAQRNAARAVLAGE